MDLDVEAPDDSGTSSSSVHNSADGGGGFRFGLLRSPDDEDYSGRMAPATSWFVTRQLFPALPPAPGIMAGQAPVPLMPPRVAAAPRRGARSGASGGAREEDAAQAQVSNIRLMDCYCFPRGTPLIRSKIRPCCFAGSIIDN